MHKIPGHNVPRERLHLQAPKYGWPGAAICLCISIICAVLEDNQSWGQQVPSASPPSRFLRQASATQDVAADDSTANNPLDDPDDILNLADESLDSLSAKSVIVPAMDMEVTSVSRTESTVGRSPAAVFVVTNEMIRRSGVRSIPDALRLVPGVNVARVSANRWAISIRGFNAEYANKLLVQIDGRSVYNPVFSGVYWDQHDLLLEDVERIEVIRGPGATVWGANAVNGVINIITKHARDTQGVFVQGGGGTEERGFGAIRYGGRIGDSLYYRLYGKWDERDGGWATPDAADDWRSGRGGFRVDWQPCECTTFTLQGDFYEGKSGWAYNAAIPPPQYQLSGVHADQVPAGRNILTRYSRKLSDESDWSIQLYWDHAKRPDKPQNYGQFFQSCDTFDLDFQHRFPLGHCHSLIWGFGYRNTRNVVDGNLTVSFNPPVRSFGIISYFVQDQITLCEDLLYLTLGSKFEHNDFSGFEIQPTARLLWTLDERRAAWASVSRAVRTPSRMDQDITLNAPMGEYVPGYIQTFGSMAVESEQLIAYEIGYRAQPSDAFWWDLAFFYNDYDDLVTALPGVPYVPNTYANAMRGNTYGFELATTYKVNPCWRLGSGYSFLVMDLQGVGSGSNEGESPRNQVYLQSGWDLGPSWKLDMTWRYVDSLAALGVPDYMVMDVRLAWLPSENLEVAVVGRNLLDEHHPEFSTRSFYPSEVQQEVYGTVTCRY